MHENVKPNFPSFAGIFLASFQGHTKGIMSMASGNVRWSALKRQQQCEDESFTLSMAHLPLSSSSRVGSSCSARSVERRDLETSKYGQDSKRSLRKSIPHTRNPSKPRKLRWISRVYGVRWRAGHKSLALFVSPEILLPTRARSTKNFTLRRCVGRRVDENR
jgi:hypothetical protein